jgi:hypothetical protein
VLQVLAAQSMPAALAADGPRLSATLNALQARLAQSSVPPPVANPVLSRENLAARWSQESFNSFRQEVASAAAKAKRAVESTDDHEASALWREILGEDFPLPENTDEGIELADTSHAKRPVSQGWTEGLDPRFRITVKAQVFAEDRKRRIGRESAKARLLDGALLMAGWKIRFEAQVEAPQPTTVWWQVVNTGGHARSVNGLRGDFFKGKALNGEPSGNERVNWEDTAYTGSHWIECFLVRGSTIVARSGRLLVNVRNPRFRFRR